MGFSGTHNNLLDEGQKYLFNCKESAVGVAICELMGKAASY